MSSLSLVVHEDHDEVLEQVDSIEVDLQALANGIISLLDFSVMNDLLGII